MATHSSRDFLLNKKQNNSASDRDVNIRHPFYRKLTAIAVLCCFCWQAGFVSAATATTAATLPWPETVYSYYANNAQLENVLREFAGSFSLSLQMYSPMPGVVSGRFNTQSPTEFINRLGGVYGFNWFTYAGTLYVSKSSDMTTKALSSSSSIGDLRQALIDLNILDTRFGWGELPKQGVVLVSGPPAYVKLVETTLASLPLVADAQQVNVFRLKHASVEDRTIKIRDQVITTQGVASILKNLITGNVSGVGNVSGDALNKIAEPLRNNNAADNANNSAANNNAANNTNTSSNKILRVPRAPAIQADTRLNAVIVQDIPERMPIYQQLIAQLDVPTALIQIEAMIIDINSTRLEELGVNWGARSGGLAAGFGNLNVPADGNTLSIVKGTTAALVNPSTIVAGAGNYLVSRIRALESIGEARIQSTPSILTTDNLSAVIDSSETFYVRVTSDNSATLNPVTAGTTLRVTPRLVQDGANNGVQLVVDIEDGQIQDRQVDSLPTVRRSNVSTQALLNENEALLIAGYNREQNIERNNRIPLLGGLPIVGRLFSNKQIDKQHNERLFLIRPTVVSMPGLANNLATNNLRTPTQAGQSTQSAQPAPVLTSPPLAPQPATTSSLVQQNTPLQTAPVQVANVAPAAPQMLPQETPRLVPQVSKVVPTPIPTPVITQAPVVTATPIVVASAPVAATPTPVLASAAVAMPIAVSAPTPVASSVPVSSMIVAPNVTPSVVASAPATAQTGSVQVANVRQVTNVVPAAPQVSKLVPTPIPVITQAPAVTPTPIVVASAPVAATPTPVLTTVALATPIAASTVELAPAPTSIAVVEAVPASANLTVQAPQASTSEVKNNVVALSDEEILKQPPVIAKKNTSPKVVNTLAVAEVNSLAPTKSSITENAVPKHEKILAKLENSNQATSATVQKITGKNTAENINEPTVVVIPDLDSTQVKPASVAVLAQTIVPNISFGNVAQKVDDQFQQARQKSSASENLAINQPVVTVVKLEKPSAASTPNPRAEALFNAKQFAQANWANNLSSISFAGVAQDLNHRLQPIWQAPIAEQVKLRAEQIAKAKLEEKPVTSSMPVTKLAEQIQQTSNKKIKLPKQASVEIVQAAVEVNPAPRIKLKEMIAADGSSQLVLVEDSASTNTQPLIDKAGLRRGIYKGVVTLTKNPGLLQAAEIVSRQFAQEFKLNHATQLAEVQNIQPVQNIQRKQKTMPKPTDPAIIALGHLEALDQATAVVLTRTMTQVLREKPQIIVNQQNQKLLNEPLANQQTTIATFTIPAESTNSENHQETTPVVNTTQPGNVSATKFAKVEEVTKVTTKNVVTTAPKLEQLKQAQVNDAGIEKNSPPQALPVFAELNQTNLQTVKNEIAQNEPEISPRLSYQISENGTLRLVSSSEAQMNAENTDSSEFEAYVRSQSPIEKKQAEQNNRLNSAT